MNRQLIIILTIMAVATLAMWYSVQKRPTVKPLDTITVGTNAEFPPFSYKEGDDIVGYDIDVINEVLKRLDKGMIIKDMPFDALIPEVQLGNIHVVAAGMTPTEERAKRVLFTKPHLTGNPLIIVTLKSAPEITGIDDLIEKEVVVNEGYLADMYMSNQEGVNITRLSSAMVSDGILALESGRAFAFVTAEKSIQPFFDKVGKDKFNVIPIEGTEESSAFVVSKFYPELRDQIQVILDRMQDDGTLDEIKKKWKV